MSYKKVLDRLDYNEKRIREVLKDIHELKFKILVCEGNSIMEVLSSEKSRIELALTVTNLKKEAAELLGMSYRTLHRKLIEYKIK